MRIVLEVDDEICPFPSLAGFSELDWSIFGKDIDSIIKKLVTSSIASNTDSKSIYICFRNVLLAGRVIWVVARVRPSDRIYILAR